MGNGGSSRGVWQEETISTTFMILWIVPDV